MKFLLAINDLNFGGGQQTVIQQANELFARGVDVRVLTLLDSDHGLVKRLEIPTEHRIHISFRSLFDFRAYSRLIYWLKTYRPDVVESNLFFTNTVLRVSRLFVGMPRLFVREGNIPVEKGIGARCIDILLSPLVTGVIINAAAFGKALKSVYPGRPFFIIYNGVSQDFFDIVREETEPPTVTVIGSLTYKKGHTYLVEAIHLLRKKQLPTKPPQVLIVGNGPLRSHLEQQVYEYGLEEIIHFHPASADSHSIFKRTSILVIPSLWEGVPNVLLEALAAGIPCIASSVGGIPEIIKNEENGILVQAQDADMLAQTLAEVLNNAVLRDSLSESARERMQGYTWKRHVDELLSVVS